MGADGTSATKRMTTAEFLAWENRQEGRYEFDNGRIVAMAGGTLGQDIVRRSLVVSLGVGLRGKPCKPQIDVKIVSPNGNVRYPDVAILCGQRDRTLTAITDPTVVIEVLSRSTQSTDYILKTVDYGAIPSVTHYLIFSQDEPVVDVISRGEDGWRPRGPVQGLDATIDLPSIGVTLALADIYAEIASA